MTISSIQKALSRIAGMVSVGSITLHPEDLDMVLREDRTLRSLAEGSTPYSYIHTGRTFEVRTSSRVARGSIAISYLHETGEA